MKSRRELNFIASYNWISYPLYIIGKSLHRNRKRIKRGVITLSAIIIGVTLSNLVKPVTEVVIASYTNAVELKRAEILNTAREAWEREQEFVRQQREKVRRAAYDKKHKEMLEKERIQKVEEEIKENFGIGDYIIVTWWGTDYGTGPDAPEYASKTGQISKIDGEYIYGTWGDNCGLKWESEHWEICSKKEYLDARANEQKKRDRMNNKNKKKFKSWGLYPGTTNHLN